MIKDKSEITTALSKLLNEHGIDSQTDTPDYILANYLVECLEAYVKAIDARRAWWGKIYFPNVR